MNEKYEKFSSMKLNVIYLFQIIGLFYMSSIRENRTVQDRTCYKKLVTYINSLFAQLESLKWRIQYIMKALYVISLVIDNVLCALLRYSEVYDTSSLIIV